MMRKHISWIMCGAVTAAGMFGAGKAGAQDWPDSLELNQLFRVIVTGKKSGATNTSNIKGTAWAIAPRILITADHVTGKAFTWENKFPQQKQFVPYRDVAIRYPEKKLNPGQRPYNLEGGIVTPSPFESIDAARIGFPSLEANPLLLSACGIIASQEYRVMKFAGGEEYQPIEVKLYNKSFGRSTLGDSNSVVVMATDKGVIKEGDSGSPVFGPDNRVVGLVSAIADDDQNATRDEVHITLVKSFIDLVPHEINGQAMLDIPCSERAKLAQIDVLDADIKVASATIKALGAENKALTSRVEEMERRNDLLLEQVNTLLWNQVRLADNIERATGRESEDTTDLSGLTTNDKNAAFWARNKRVFETIQPQLPLRPTVSRISSELGNPDWTLSGSISAKEEVSISFTYERALSGPEYASDLKFCFTPVVWDVPDDTTTNKDPSHRKFYEALEGPFAFNSEELSICDTLQHDAFLSGTSEAETFTKGSYKWEGRTGLIGSMRRNVKQQYPDSAWDGLYYLQIFEPHPPTVEHPNSYQLHTRAFVDLIRDTGAPAEGSSLPCIIFSNPKSLLDAIYSSAIELTEEDTCE